MKIYRLLLLMLLGIPSFAQTHTFPATDTNNSFTGSNTFSGDLITKVTPVIDIRAYGAVADGAFTTNGCGAGNNCWMSPGGFGHANLLALQNAVAALPNGGTILFPNSGTNNWMIGSTADCVAAGGATAGQLVKLTDKITIQGQGQWATVLMLAPSTQCVMFAPNNGSVGNKFVTIRDIRLDGNEITDGTHNDFLHPSNNLSTNANGQAINWNGLSLSDGPTLNLINVEVSGFVGDPGNQAAILINGNTFGFAYNLRISYNQWARGLWHKSSDWTFINLYMVTNGGWNAAENLVLQGGAANLFLGPYIGGGDGGLSQIQLNATTANKFEDCIDDAANKMDLRLINSNQNQWVNCQFTNPGQSGSAPTAFVNIEGTSSDNQFIGSQYGPSAFNIPQIREQDTAGNTYIYDNKFFTTGAVGALSLRSGGGSIAHDNSGNGVTDTPFNLLGSGTISAPELAFNADPTTGWYRRSANFWSWAASGSEDFYIGPNQIGIGNGSSLAFGSGSLSAVATDFGLSRIAAGIGGIGNANAADTSGTLQLSRIKAGSLVPTCTFTSGGGTSPSCAVDTGSSDSAGIIVLTTGSGSPGSNGSVTLTFSAGTAFGTNRPSCIFMPSQNGAGQWVQSTTLTASFFDKTPSTTSDLENWQNGATTLSTATAYWVNYHCWAK